MGEEKGFEIKDRRLRMQESPESESSEAATGAPNAKEEAAHSEQPTHKTLPPINFTSFILSLATSGLIQLGYQANPQGGSKSADLGLARQTIDLLAILQEKTKGNLTSEEEAQLSQTLYALRMAFVEVEKNVCSF